MAVSLEFDLDPDDIQDAEVIDKQMSFANHADCVIVGAGIAGLVAGRSLYARGRSVLIVDKGRDVGGRLATRGFAGGRFDYGAQFFTVRNSAFRPLVDEWLEAGIVTPWSEGFALPDGKLKNTGDIHYSGAGGMRTITKHLAQNLDVRSRIEVTAISIEKGNWKVLDASGNVFRGKALILTPPVPQSLALLGAGNVPLVKSLQEELSRFTYNPCIAAMAMLEGPSRIPPPGGIWFSGEPLAWVADNTQKGICTEAGIGSSITLHAGPEFSRSHWGDATQTAGILLQRAAPWLGARVKQFQTHRWRFARPTHVHDEPLLSLRCPAQLLFAGDAFGGSRVEGAVLSGLAAAACI
jgi:predicted NAD/FAD-dependent oxidoreductase